MPSAEPKGKANAGNKTKGKTTVPSTDKDENLLGLKTTSRSETPSSYNNATRTTLDAMASQVQPAATETITITASPRPALPASVSPAAILLPFLFAISILAIGGIWWIRQRRRKLQSELDHCEGMKIGREPFTPSTKVRAWIAEHVSTTVKILRHPNRYSSALMEADSGPSKRSVPTMRQLSKPFPESKKPMNMKDKGKVQPQVRNTPSDKKEGKSKHKPEPLDLRTTRKTPQIVPAPPVRKTASINSMTSMPIVSDVLHPAPAEPIPVPKNLNELRKPAVRTSDKKDVDVPEPKAEEDTRKINSNRDSVPAPQTAASTSTFFCKGSGQSRMTTTTDASFFCQGVASGRPEGRQRPPMPTVPPQFASETPKLKRPLIPSVRAMSSFHGDVTFDEVERHIEAEEEDDTGRLPSYYDIRSQAALSSISRPGVPPNSTVSDELKDDW